MTEASSIQPMPDPYKQSEDMRPRVYTTREAWRGMSEGDQPLTLLGVTLPPTAVVLDPNVGFERALIDMVQTARRKRADYALDSDEFSNFRGPADLIGRPAWLVALMEVQWKLERIKSLRENGRMNDPKNESVHDSVLDAAVFGVIALALKMEEESSSAGDLPQPGED